jgi:hypothetical protein
MSDTILFISFCALSGPLFSLAVRWWKREWSPLRVSMVSAGVMPGVLIGLCLLLFVHAATSSAEACGVDACGMAMMAATYVSGFAVVGFVLGWAATFGLQLVLVRR